jgi:membrane protease YdiL (CAAX protease family)
MPAGGVRRPSAMANALLSLRSWPWRVGVAVGLPWLFGFLLDRLVRLPGGRIERAIEWRILVTAFDLVVLLALLRWMEGCTLRETGLFGRAGFLRRVSEGVALGAGPVALHGAAFAAAGMYVFSLPGTATVVEAVALAAVLLLVGFEEELRYRALAFRTLDQGVGSGLAMVISGVFFGVSHATNPGATPLGVVAIAVGGVFLAACYLRYRNLWVPIGFHFAWNTTLGVVLGLPISGVQIPGLLHAGIAGPDFWTGGRFGPEASPALQPFFFLAATFYVWRVVVEGKLTPPLWKARPEPLPLESTVATSPSRLSNPRPDS